MMRLGSRMILAAAIGWAAVAGATLAAYRDPGRPFRTSTIAIWTLLGALLVIGSLVVARLVWRVAGPAGPRPNLSDPSDVALLTRAREHARLILRAWPSLGALGEPADPAPVLDQTLRDLRVALVERQALRSAYRRTRTTRWPVSDADSPALTHRRLLLLERIRDRDVDISARLHRLVELVDACVSYLGHRAAWERTRRVVDEVDELLDVTSRIARPADGRERLSALAERTTAVVHAYRELTP